jgi:hypothetical protein
MAGKKKVMERRSGLCPSEKELSEWRSITKIPLVKNTLYRVYFNSFTFIFVVIEYIFSTKNFHK